MSSDTLESEINMHGCCERNKLSICLSILLLFTIGVLVIVIYFFIGTTLFFVEEAGNCEEPICFESSAEISEFIDDSKDPCDDFYNFVCGNFIKTSYEKQINNPLNAERDRIKRHMDSFIVEPLSFNDPHPVKMQKQFFHSCLDEEKFDQDQNKFFLHKLKEVAEWPLLRRFEFDQHEFAFDWIDVMLRARWYKLPFEWFFKIDLHERVVFYDRESQETINIIKLARPENCGMVLTEDYFTMQREILEQVMTPVLDTIQELRSLRKLETELHSLCANMTNGEVTVEQVSFLNWNNFTMRHILSTLTGQIRWSPNAEVAIERNYLFALNKLLRETPKMAQANYILWKIILYFAPYLSAPIREVYLEYMYPGVSRFEFCLEDTKSKFKFVSELVDLSEYDQSSAEDGRELADAIRNEMVASVENIKWRSNKTREWYIDFFENLDELIGGPEEIFEENFLHEQTPFENLNFQSTNAIQMLLDWSESVFKFKISMLGKRPLVPLDLAFTVNSELTPVLDEDEEQLILPTAAFDSFLYKNDRPQYLNYAGLGSIVGTELFKRLHLSSSSKHDSFAGFEQTKKCLIGSLQRTDKHINATLVFSKNYDSLLGQELAYRTYQKYVEENEEEQQLPNLPYTPNQLFWIKSSMNWCYHALPEEENPLDMEEIFKYRIIEMVKNSESFAMDFNCTSDALMNPPNKCSLL